MPNDELHHPPPICHQLPTSSSTGTRSPSSSSVRPTAKPPSTPVTSVAPQWRDLASSHALKSSSMNPAKKTRNKKLAFHNPKYPFPMNRIIPPSPDVYRLAPHHGDPTRSVCGSRIQPQPATPGMRPTSCRQPTHPNTCNSLSLLML